MHEQTKHLLLDSTEAVAQGKGRSVVFSPLPSEYITAQKVFGMKNGSRFKGTAHEKSELRFG